MGERVHLPVVDSFESSIDADGRRRFIHTADVKGRFVTARRCIFAALIGIWVALPLIPIGGHPAVLLDVERRRFYLFGQTFNSQDVWLVFFVLTGAAFALAVGTSIAGRAFCGFACPQTVFLDGVFRPIERVTEGSREERRRRDAGPWTANRVARKLAKHALYLTAAFLIAHILLSFFVPLPATIRMVLGRPADHPQAFAWMSVVTLLLYGNYAWFREQLCLVICPYGRLQASLVDGDSLVVGYDTKRGEPRGKVGKGTGDCVDCKRCVVVCPTGIDIRNGIQLDCIGCTACIDACDDIMTRLHRPKGFIRYDSQVGFSGGKRRFWRPRLTVYAVLALAGLAAATTAFAVRTSFEATLTRARGAPFVLEGDRVRNTFVVHLINKLDEPVHFRIVSESPAGIEVDVADAVDVPAMGNTTIPCVASMSATTKSAASVKLSVLLTEKGETRVLETKLVRPTP